jgi:beta-galactosidase GanA
MVENVPTAAQRALTRRSVLTGIAGTAGGLVLGAPQIAAAAIRPTSSDVLPSARSAATTTHSVTFDRYSLSIDGERLFVWSGEFHPFRLPSPSLWLDVLQKLKANGYNTVCMYFNWSYHSPASGVYDFTGVRDMGAALDAAAQAGLYVIARPGPYINGELNAGGFPGWLTATAGTARTDNATYEANADQWLTQINAILAAHQLTTGGGTVLLYQIENEYASNTNSATGIDYMEHLYAKARADGITVPIFHNDKGRDGNWIPGSFTTGDSNYLYAFDGYPSATGTPPDWGYYGSGGLTGGSTASPNTPGFMAEFGGGWFDPWGDATFGGAGYPAERAIDNAVYERRFYLTNIANGIKIHNVYMTFGGTSWGWLPAPVVYTSYDYGAAISEARQLTTKIPPMKQIGSLLHGVADLAMLEVAATAAASNSLITTYHLTNPDTGAQFYFVRNDHTTDVSFTLPVDTADGSYTVPQSGSLNLDGQDMKILVADYALDSQHLVYTTSHLVTHALIGSRDVALLAGRDEVGGETVLRRSAEPTVTVLSGSGVTTTWNSATGDLRLNYTHNGLVEVLVAGSGSTAPLLLLIADDDTAATFWRLDDATVGPVLVRGPELVRTVSSQSPEILLTGDTIAAAPLEVWTASAITKVSWNGASVTVGATSSGSLLASKELAAAPSVSLPALTGWVYSEENPEISPSFNDSAWTVADKTTSNSTTAIPSGQPVLFVDDYGFHYGDVWYRGTWTQTSAATSVTLTYQTGTVGLLLVWLDGTYLGHSQTATPTSSQSTTSLWSAAPEFAIPTALQSNGTHVISVLVRSMAHQEDGGANNAFKAALGLLSVTFGGTKPAVTWRIQGALGGETLTDTVRGPLNTGGLYGERKGWHLAGYPDQNWAPITLPSADKRAGVAWYRTTFTLDIAAGVDASLGLTVTESNATRPYRALFFLNGWNIGQYINAVGPQTTFVLPNGLLNPQGSNTLSVAVISSDTTGGLGALALTNLGTAAGGVTVSLVDSPDYAELYG